MAERRDSDAEALARRVFAFTLTGVVLFVAAAIYLVLEGAA